MTVEPGTVTESNPSLETTEDVEQISKGIVVGRKESYFDDGRNVISVIINAVSVRINMPRGTVKALMACFAVLLIVAMMLAFNAPGSKNNNDNNHDAETAVVESSREYDNDPALREEVDKILADGKITIAEFMTFARNHDVQVSLSDLPEYIEKAKELGLIGK